MKIAKWLFLAACAVLCCACSKNDPLAYVDEDADWVLYLNSSDLQDHKLVKKLEKAAKKHGDYEEFNEQLEDVLGVELKECGAKAVVWGKYDRKAGYVPCKAKAVVVFDEKIAGKIFKGIKKLAKKEGGLECTEKTIDGCDAYIFEQEHVIYESSYSYNAYNTYDEPRAPKTEKKVIFSVIKLSENALQIIFEDEPDSAAKPGRNSELAMSIDNDCVAGLAVSGKYINDAIERSTDEDPDLGDALIMIFADNKKIKLEASIDISNVD